MTADNRKTPWGAVAEALHAEGVAHIFGMPGNPLHLIDDLARFPDVKPVLVRQEVCGVFMAYAYARVTGEPGLCYGNPGPGLANMVPGILEAYSGNMPVIALANGTPSRWDGYGAFQELDSLALFRSITKWVARPTEPEKVPWVMQRAFSLATNGRPGPVVIDLPSDMALREAEIDAYRPPERWIRSRADRERIAMAADELARAKRPVIVAGNGVVLSRAGAELLSLAERLGAPVLTTPGGRGSIAEDHVLSLGQVGLYFTRPGKAYYDSADLLITVGSRMEAFQSGEWKLFPAGARFLQIDIDAASIGLNWRPDVAVVGDARLVLEDLSAALDERAVDGAAKAARLAEIAETKARFDEEVERECAEQQRPIRTRQVVHELNRVFGRNTILCNENGGADLWSYYWPYYRVLDVGDCVPPAEQTEMGLGCVGAIGAKIARPDKQVVCTTGDGAFQMYMQEISTAVEYRAAVTWVVLNNSALGWPQYGQVLEGKPRLATVFERQPDFALVATAQGATGERIENPAEVAPALERARRANAEGVPAVVDIGIALHDYPEWFQTWHREIWGMGTGIVST